MQGILFRKKTSVIPTTYQLFVKTIELKKSRLKRL